MVFDSKFPGGNATLVRQVGHTIEFAPELRDTTAEWFYWCFCIEGAEGQTWNFDMGERAFVGYQGPAVSYDMEHWHWAGPDTLKKTPGGDAYTGFQYAFRPDEKKVFFCHDMRFGPERLQRLAADLRIRPTPLATTMGGRQAALYEVGTEDQVILLLSRHHACESTGTYVLEGALRSLCAIPLKGFCVAAVPFVDTDGVYQGDQGKLRAPHDHNRDYTENPIYPEIQAIMAYARGHKIACVLDFHSPWHFGPRADTCYIVREDGVLGEAQAEFSGILEQCVRRNAGAFPYHSTHDLLFGQDWNRPDIMKHSNMTFFRKVSGLKLGATLEVPYFGTPTNPVSQEKLVALGACIGEAVRQFFSRKMEGYNA